MQTAGFELADLQGAQEPCIWQKVVELRGREIVVPIDLIVPSEVAPPGGRRGARLEGHGKRAARKISGLEAALIDNEMMSVEALEPDDLRSARLRVAGVAALLVAKTHKIVDPGRADGQPTRRGSDQHRGRALRGALRPAGRGRHRAGFTRTARSDARRAGASDMPRLHGKAVRHSE